MNDEYRIERATEEDVPLILRFIRALAEYERLSDAVVATEASLRESVFGSRPHAEVAIIYEGNEAAGFAVWFYNYSTFLGRRGLYLEDLFILPERRGRGLGRRLLAYLAAIAVDRNCGRMEWAVLDWNTPAVGFYERLGADAMSDWTIFRLAGDALTRLAAEARSPDITPGEKTRRAGLIGGTS